MVWGLFSWHSLGSLIIVEGMMDQYKCTSVLADLTVFPQDDGLYQQDNAKCHSAGSVRVWCSKSTGISIPFSPGQQTHLIFVIKFSRY
ncbi:transposable element Tcb1 transposase [Trichonephila clavipes]|nr:transposable element Tcb1 transposase [Trichonephila clavipes]